MEARKVPTKFAVSFSLAGRRRELVLPVARRVEAELGRSAVFYDTWYEDWIAGRDVDLLLRHLYDERSQLIVLCVSATHSHSAWGDAEQRAICARILSLPLSEHNSILPLRVGDGEPPGISISGQIPDVRNLTASQSAELIVSRLSLVRGLARERPSAGHQENQSMIAVRSEAGDSRSLLRLAADAIFISYRRSDEAAFAGRLYDRLSAKFGENQIFMDVDDIEPGVDFADLLKRKLEQCVALVAVIGKDWLTATDARGRRRLDDPADYVRLEIEHALARNVRLIPVLVDGAQMPRQLDLPKSIEVLTRRNAHPMSNSHFRSDVSELLTILERALMRSRRKVTWGGPNS